MQTFLPYDSFIESARCLDRLRLGKQRVEVLQLLNALAGLSKGWKSHPCTILWRNHPKALVGYGVACCDAWISRGYKDSCRDKIVAAGELLIGEGGYPPWFGDEAFHLSHKSNLIRKNAAFYRPLFGMSIPDDMPYIWPSNNENNSNS